MSERLRSSFTVVVRAISIVLAVLTVTACTAFYQQLDPPKVSVDSLRTVTTTEGVPRFEIQLRVMNPNTQPLDIAGVAYGIEVMGRELLAGVTNDVPLIEGYSEEVVTLSASLQLFELLRFVASLGTGSGELLEYTFSAKIDFNGMVPTQRVEDRGEIQLN